LEDKSGKKGMVKCFDIAKLWGELRPRKAIPTSSDNHGDHDSSRHEKDENAGLVEKRARPPRVRKKA